MPALSRLVLLLVMLAQVAAAHAQDRAAPGQPVVAGDTPMSSAETQRLRVLSAELRCLVCQNQSLADSNAELAIDLRNQVRDQIRAGQSDEQIKEYLVQRYGEFVLYRPRMTAVTGLLWVGPFLLLALGGAAMWAHVRRRQLAQQGAGQEAGTDGVSSEDHATRLARARALLREEAGESAVTAEPPR